ncbi:MAG: hypothetical protein SPJ23_04555 [Eubacteriales bacterium]|nr:hypothetical protein [Eubacteriales bacterium]
MNKQKRILPERKEALFSRVFRYSVPRAVAPALLSVIGALITGIASLFFPGSDTIYFSVFLPCSLLGIILSESILLSHLYRAFPRAQDGNGSVISAALLTSGALSVFAALFLPLLSAALLSAATRIPEADRFAELLSGHFAAVFVSFFTLFAFDFSILIAVMLTVLLAKGMRKRAGISRTCLCALPVFTGLALYYTGVFFFSSFTSINGLENLASDYLLTDNVLWILLTLGAGGLLLSLLLAPAVLLRSNRLRAPDSEK